MTQETDGQGMGADDSAYRLKPEFRRFLEIVGGDIQRAFAAWEIAKKAFLPVTPEAEFEVWQDDAVVAGCSGPRGPSLAEAMHYAVVYQTDDHPCVIQEVIRREIDPDQAHYLIAQDSTQ